MPLGGYLDVISCLICYALAKQNVNIGLVFKWLQKYRFQTWNLGEVSWRPSFIDLFSNENCFWQWFLLAKKTLYFLGKMANYCDGHSLENIAIIQFADFYSNFFISNLPTISILLCVPFDRWAQLKIGVPFLRPEKKSNKFTKIKSPRFL